MNRQTKIDADTVKYEILEQTVSGEIIHTTQAWTGSSSAGYSAFFLFLGALTLVAVAIYRYAPEPSTRRG